MSLSIHASQAAIAAHAKHTPNPAQQAKAAEPAVKGADFGALVSSIAKAKHAEPPPATPAPTEITPPTETDEVGTVIDIEV